MRVHSPMVVGRDRELRDLKNALGDAGAGRGTAIFLTGEGGIGRSRLLDAAARLAQAQGVEVWRGRASTLGPVVPFRPLTEALLSRFRGSSAPDAAELDPYRDVLGRLVPEWASGVAPAGDAALLLMAEAVLRLLVVTGRDRAGVLTLDDLQDSDPETLFVVEYLLDNIRDSNTVLVGTVRSEPSRALDIVRAGERRRSCAVFELDALDRADVRRMMALCLRTEPDRLPLAAVDLVWHNSGGNPLLVEELLHELIADGLLVVALGSWRLVAQPAARVPTALVNNVALRAQRLGPQGMSVLTSAAVLGHRFPLSVVQELTHLDDRELLRYLQAAGAAQLVTADEDSLDWYAFRHPLMVDALLRNLTPANRAQLSRRAADVVEALHPDLPGEWCRLAAELRVDDDREGAGRLFAEAGQRALAEGGTDVAVGLLTRAEELLAGSGELAIRAQVLEALLRAFGKTGQFGRAVRLSVRFAELGSSERAAALHTRLAWAAYLAARPRDGLDQVRAARALLGLGTTEIEHAAVDAAEANLLLEIPGHQHVINAEMLAKRALQVAEAEPAPSVACQSMLALGIIAADRDLDLAEQYFERTRQLAERNTLPLWRAFALIRLGCLRMLRGGEFRDLELAGVEAQRIGATTLHCAVSVIRTLHLVLCAEFDAAAESLARTEHTVSRLGLTDLVSYLATIRAILAAHRGDRRGLEDARALFSGDQSPELALGLGLGNAFCSLLEEDIDRARHELAEAAGCEEGNHTRPPLSGRYGLGLLLDVLDGGDPARFQAASTSAAAQLRWNRQFVLLGEAVLHGRAGRLELAGRTAQAAIEAGRPYRLAHHLALRLVAQSAATDGWGDAVTWLRDAEDYFHRASIPAVASACRALLRRAGASVRQRRAGVDQVPTTLRSVGVTVREYEVFQLLGERMGNKDIARRLHISPRTVEKHVARLAAKTGRPDRAALIRYAAARRGREGVFR